VQRLARPPCREPTTVLRRARFDVGLTNIWDYAIRQRSRWARGDPATSGRSTPTFANGYLHVDEAGFLNRGTELGLDNASYPTLVNEITTLAVSLGFPVGDALDPCYV